MYLPSYFRKKSNTKRKQNFRKTLFANISFFMMIMMIVILFRHRNEPLYKMDEGATHPLCVTKQHYLEDNLISFNYTYQNYYFQQGKNFLRTEYTFKTLGTAMRAPGNNRTIRIIHFSVECK